MSTRAWVVDRPLRAPNCLESSLGTTWFMVQLPTYDSSTLDKVGVKEIGHRSDSILCGGWTLGTGTTLVCFHISGKIPVLRDVLKIQQTGSAKNAEKSNFRVNNFGDSGSIPTKLFHATCHCCERNFDFLN